MKNALSNLMMTFVLEKLENDISYVIPSEYIENLINLDRARKQVTTMRNQIIEGYQDVIQGRTQDFSGDLMVDMRAYHKSKL